MTKAKPVVDRTEAGAAIDRSIELLKTLKVHLRAKKLDGRTLDSLLEAVSRNLEPTAKQFQQQRSDDLDADIALYASLRDEQ